MLKKLFWLIHDRGIRKMLNSGMRVGKNTLIFNDVEDFGCDPQLIKIGNNCVIASGVRFLTLPAFIKSSMGGKDQGVNDKGFQGIVVHDNCFLGINSIIYPNVVIGPDAIIGAGSVVIDDVLPNMCVCGNPSRVTCTLDIYRAVCKRSIIREYTSENKREVLSQHFWNLKTNTTAKTTELSVEK